ncbi:hypothetical protein BC938DRAFT_477504 [Jimgerdemannia flammicorona]|uniref:Uncharacterized protein n=1 Tax=Jimgerdemannia flammicorona TaxID=994334 RepID=A0A433P9G9_9FUNG|nr:hypothetical protein BC938DRAFT_477504 [Jimgerdemannia flammicorona]
MSKTWLRLPQDPITADRLPLQIGAQVSPSRYNTFVVRRESPGCKFELQADGRVFVVDMAYAEHEDAVMILQKYFNIANDDAVFDAPIKASGQPLYDEPGGSGILIAPDISVSPENGHVQAPTIPYPGPPPGDIRGNPHARVICEIALHQSTHDWESKCQCWLRQLYVRYVFGIKIHGMRDARNAQGQNHRSMTVSLQ